MKKHDILFNKASRLLDKAMKIWDKDDKKNFAYADLCYEQAVEIRDTYFANKKVLTDDLEPF